jgi:hypothetical protein
MNTNAFVIAVLTAAMALHVSAQTQKPRVVDDPSDVMAGAMPKFPAFPKLARKPGHIRGWVKDARGKPLKNARIEIGSTAIGGAKTYVMARSGRERFLRSPAAAWRCSVLGAGSVVTLGGMRANLPLHVVDGERDTFSAQKGDVENFVLLALRHCLTRRGQREPDLRVLLLWRLGEAHLLDAVCRQPDTQGRHDRSIAAAARSAH